jgi:hypothetical protein
MRGSLYFLLQILIVISGYPVCAFKKPYWHPNWGRGIPGTGISKDSLAPQVFFTAEFGHFLVTIFFYNYFLRKFFEILVLEENPGTKKKSWVSAFQIPVLEKNPGYRDLKSSTGNHIESVYHRENFLGASRPSKTLTGVLRDLQNRLSLRSLLYAKRK